MNNKNDPDEPQLHDSPQDQDGESVSGSAPDPSSDDNVLDNAHDMGLYDDADEENPKPLNIAAEIEKDEKTHREK